MKSLLEHNADTAELRTGVEKLATVSQRMGQAMYAQAAQQAPTEQAEHTEEPDSARQHEEEEGVVDAEIVDDERDAKGGAA